MVKFFYLRDRFNNPQACVAFNYDKINMILSYGISTCSSQDKFSKSVARDLAQARINDNVVKTDLLKFTDQLKMVLKLLLDSKTSRVRRLSKQWFNRKITQSKN